MLICIAGDIHRALDQLYEGVLDVQRDLEVLPGLFYMRSGGTMDLGEGRDIICVGGCFEPIGPRAAVGARRSAIGGWFDDAHVAGPTLAGSPT